MVELNKKESKKFLERMIKTEKRKPTKKERELAKELQNNSKYFDVENTKGAGVSEQLEVIGFMMHDDVIEVVNPCAIPMDFMLDSIKHYKKNPPKKGEVTNVCFIAIKFPFLKKLKSKIRGKVK